MSALDDPAPGFEAWVTGFLKDFFPAFPKVEAVVAVGGLDLGFGSLVTTVGAQMVLFVAGAFDDDRVECLW